MRFLQATILLVLFNILLGCKKEMAEVVSAFSASGMGAPTNSMSMRCFPDLADSAQLNTDIVVTLDQFGINLYSADVMLLKGTTRVSGTQKISKKEIRFTPDAELSPSTTYKVQVVLILETTVNDARQVSINGNVHPRTLPDTTRHFVSWKFATHGAYRYTMNRTSQWVTDFRRDGNKIVQMGGFLYNYGGWTSEPDQSYNDIYRSSGDLTQWERLPDAPWEGRHTYGIGKLDSTLFVFGGDYLSTRFDVWKSDNGENFTPVSQDLESFLGPRFLYGACVHNSKLYVMGGQSGLGADSALTDVWWSSNGSLWRRVANNLPFLGKNIAGSVVSFNKKIWVVGGGYYRSDDLSERYTNHVYSSKDGVTWKQEPDAPWLPRQYGDLCVWNNRLWMVGGYNEENLADVWYMDTAGQWHEFETPALFEPRHASGVGVYNDKLVIVAGNYHNDCWTIEKM